MSFIEHPTRENTVAALKLAGDKICSYIGEKWPRRCDCKYDPTTETCVEHETTKSCF